MRSSISEYCERRVLKMHPRLEILIRPAEVTHMVLSAGRCGTVTLFNSLRRAYGDRVVHVHNDNYLNDRLLQTEPDAVRLKVADIVQHNFERYGTTTTILSAYREVVSRSVSGFFHQLNPSLGLEPAAILDRYRDDIPALFKQYVRFVDRVYYRRLKRDVLLHEFRDLGFDVHSAVFDHDNRCCVLETPAARGLLLRFDDMDCWQTAIRSFVADRAFALHPANLSRNYWYADLYERFLKSFQPIKDQLDLMFALHRKHMNFYYTAEQRASIIDGWYSRCVSR